MTRWSRTGRTNCMPAARSRLAQRVHRTDKLLAPEALGSGKVQDLRHHESISPVHPAASGDDAADGGRVTSWNRSLPAAPGVRPSRSRLSNDPSYDILSGSEPGRSEEHTSELQSRRELVCR